MKRNNKKGFTIVELVIVIAVIAILAAVLIPTFSSLVKKATIAADTQLAKNLNTALTMAEAEDDVDGFDDVLAALREAGFIISNINPTTEGWYYVWESESNQILLVDSTNNWEVKYSSKTLTNVEPGKTWHFAISNKTDADNVETALGDKVVIKRAIAAVEDLKAALSEGGEIFLDESVVLDAENLLVFDKADANTTINLGSAQLSTNGLLDGEVPIQIKKGTVTIKGGVIGGGGAYIDADGKRVNSSLETEEGSTVTIDGTVFNVSASGYVTFMGDATVKNTTIDSEGMGVYCGANGNVVLENVTIDSAGRCVWATNYNGVDHATASATITIKSGTYNGGTGTFSDSYAAVPIVAFSGDIIIEGGNFTTGSGKFFQVMYDYGSITLKGGTFGGKTLSELGKTGIENLCNGTFKVTDNNDGTFTITLK